MLRPYSKLVFAMSLAIALLFVVVAPLSTWAATLPPSFRLSGPTLGQVSPVLTSYLPLVLKPVPGSSANSLAAFPGAEGFGAIASGGRGGQVLYVTTLAADPNGVLPGSLNWALRQNYPRYLLFKVSGVISAAANIVAGDVTIAGQSSPGGIIVRGLVCDGHYEQHSCDNLIIRHLRSRPATHLDGSLAALDDALRLDGLQRFIIDHSSFANASDEAVQLSWAMSGTLQNSIFAETVGEHAHLGGMLLNYSHSSHPQDYLSIHHNMWHRLGGRMPEISCESSDFPDGPGQNSDCLSHPLHLELTSNLIWDPGINLWYTPYVDGNPAVGPYRLALNWVNNYMVARPGSFSYGMILHDVLDVSANDLFFSGNRLNLYPAYSDYQLAYCCNDFPANSPNLDLGMATRRTTRHDFPVIATTAAGQVISYTIATVGAFPRDPQDQRFIDALTSGLIDSTPTDQVGAPDAFALNFDPASPPPAPLDSDSDGMPDSWEISHGLNPTLADHNGTQLSLSLTGVAGYTNLECYLNELADSLVPSN